MEATAEEFAAAADAGDVTAASNALRAITEAGANSPGAASAAVPALASRLAQLASALGKDDPLPAYLPDLLRALRNACAFGDVAATDAACLGDAPVPNALRRLLPVLASAASGATDDGDASVTALAVACQLCANAVRGGSDAASARLWSEVWPRAVAPIAALRGVAANRAHPPLCMMAHARCTRLQSSRLNEERGDGNDEAQARRGSGAPEPPTNVGAVCGFEAGRTVWVPLLEASCDPAMEAWPGAGGGEWLHRFVAKACAFSGEFAPQLCRSLAPRAEKTAANRDDRLRAKMLTTGVGDEDEDEDEARRRAAAFRDVADDEDHSELFSLAQATLLHLVREEVSAAPGVDPDAAPDAGPEAHLVLCEGTLSYLLDATSRAAGAVQAAATAKIIEESAEKSAAAARCVLEECLGIWRVVTEREVKPRIVQTAGDVVTAACAMGLPRLLLALTTAMPPPLGAGQTSKATGPTAAPKLNPEYVAPVSLKDGHPPFPCVRAWPGYRVDCIAPLANAMFGRPRVCDQVFELGGCGAVLAATRGEDGDDYLREWALWGVRNLCAGSDAARLEIEQMQPQAAADSQQLTAMGLNVEVDPETGKVRVGGVKKTGVAAAPAPGANAPAGGALPGGLLLGPEGARTPAGKAAVAALMAGLKVDPKDVEEDGDEEFEVPSNWKVADLS